uniref:Aldose 1-epimerase n=1 Tax=Cyanothece sp. (strain PCC 7425 / ATCC 29141) TaxID=395961 RepID=B8HVU8_CYAP4
MYKTFSLSDPQQQSRLEVVPERGGIITRWQVQGEEILYLDQERFADPTLSVRGGIPILFPICGNLPGDTFSDRSQSYPLKQHGFARNLPWQVLAQGENFITLELASNPITLAQYPFEFRLEFTYQLRGNRLDILQQVSNTGTRDLPFSLGLHPYFVVTDKTGLEFELPAQQMLDQLTKTSHPFDHRFDWNAAELDLAFRPLSAQQTIVRDRNRNLSLTLSYTPPYSTLVFWTIRGKDYYCLEPWTAPRNALITGEDLTTLAPAASLNTAVSLTVEL